MKNYIYKVKDFIIGHYLSKTTRFNVITGLLCAFAENSSVLTDVLPDSWKSIAILLITVGNIYFRSITINSLDEKLRNSDTFQQEAK